MEITETKPQPSVQGPATTRAVDDIVYDAMREQVDQPARRFWLPFIGLILVCVVMLYLFIVYLLQQQGIASLPLSGFVSAMVTTSSDNFLFLMLLSILAPTAVAVVMNVPLYTWHFSLTDFAARYGLTMHTAGTNPKYLFLAPIGRNTFTGNLTERASGTMYGRTITIYYNVHSENCSIVVRMSLVQRLSGWVTLLSHWVKGPDRYVDLYAPYERVLFPSGEFNKAFDVYASDQRLAYYLFHPDTMEKLLVLGAHLWVEVYEDSLFLAYRVMPNVELVDRDIRLLINTILPDLENSIRAAGK